MGLMMINLKERMEGILRDSIAEGRTAITTTTLLELVSELGGDTDLVGRYMESTCKNGLHDITGVITYVFILLKDVKND